MNSPVTSATGLRPYQSAIFGLFYRLAGKIVPRILGLLQQYRPIAACGPETGVGRFGGKADSRTMPPERISEFTPVVPENPIRSIRAIR
jgi:hypothetical protein